MNDIPSIWTLSRQEIEATLIAGRSARREYSETDKAAVRTVLDRPDFDRLSEDERGAAFSTAYARSTSGQPLATVASTGSPLLAIGWTLLAASLCELAFVYFGYSTSVHSDAEFTVASYLPARDTINIGLLQNQLMLFLLGLAGVVCPTLLIGIGTISTALRTLADRPV